MQPQAHLHNRRGGGSPDIKNVYHILDDVLRVMHVKHRISLLFEIWTDKETAEVISVGK